MVKRTRATSRFLASIAIASFLLPGVGFAQEEDALEDEVAEQGSSASAGEAIYDVAVLRPFDFLGFVVSTAAFVPAAVMTAPGGRSSIEEAFDILVVEPYEVVFQRPLGDFY